MSDNNYPRPLGATPLPGPLVNPLTGETIVECARRQMREIRQIPGCRPGDARAIVRRRAEALARSPMACRDSRLQDFYIALAAFLEEG